MDPNAHPSNLPEEMSLENIPLPSEPHPPPVDQVNMPEITSSNVSTHGIVYGTYSTHTTGTYPDTTSTLAYTVNSNEYLNQNMQLNCPVTASETFESDLSQDLFISSQNNQNTDNVEAFSNPTNPDLNLNEHQNLTGNDIFIQQNLNENISSSSSDCINTVTSSENFEIYNADSAVDSTSMLIEQANSSITENVLRNNEVHSNNLVINEDNNSFEISMGDTTSSNELNPSSNNENANFEAYNTLNQTTNELTVNSSDLNEPTGGYNELQMSSNELNSSSNELNLDSSELNSSSMGLNPNNDDSNELNSSSNDLNLGSSLSSNDNLASNELNSSSTGINLDSNELGSSLNQNATGLSQNFVLEGSDDPNVNSNVLIEENVISHENIDESEQNYMVATSSEHGEAQFIVEQHVDSQQSEENVEEMEISEFVKINPSSSANKRLTDKISAVKEAAEIVRAFESDEEEEEYEEIDKAKQFEVKSKEVSQKDVNKQNTGNEVEVEGQKNTKQYGKSTGNTKETMENEIQTNKKQNKGYTQSEVLNKNQDYNKHTQVYIQQTEDYNPKEALSETGEPQQQFQNKKDQQYIAENVEIEHIQTETEVLNESDEYIQEQIVYEHQEVIEGDVKLQKQCQIVDNNGIILGEAGLSDVACAEEIIIQGENLDSDITQVYIVNDYVMADGTTLVAIEEDENKNDNDNIEVLLEKFEEKKPKTTTTKKIKDEIKVEVPCHVLGRDIENPAVDPSRNGKIPPKPRLGVKIPNRNLTSQIVTKQEIVNEVMKRNKAKQVDEMDVIPNSKSNLFAKKLTHRLAQKIAPDTENSASNSSSNSSSSQVVDNPQPSSSKIQNNSDLLAILEGDDESQEEEEEVQLPENFKDLEKEIALKQLQDLTDLKTYRKTVLNKKLGKIPNEDNIEIDKNLIIEKQAVSKKTAGESNKKATGDLNKKATNETNAKDGNKKVGRNKKITELDTKKANIKTDKKGNTGLDKKTNAGQDKKIGVEKESNTVNKKESNMPNKKEDSVLNKKEGDVLNKKDNSVSNKKESSALNKKESDDLIAQEDIDLNEEGIDAANTNANELNENVGEATTEELSKKIVGVLNKNLEKAAELKNAKKQLITNKVAKKQQNEAQEADNVRLTRSNKQPESKTKEIKTEPNEDNPKFSSNLAIKTYSRKRRYAEEEEEEEEEELDEEYEEIEEVEEAKPVKKVIKSEPSENVYVTKSSRVIKKKVIWDPDEIQTKNKGLIKTENLKDKQNVKIVVKEPGKVGRPPLNKNLNLTGKKDVKNVNVNQKTINVKIVEVKTNQKSDNTIKSPKKPIQLNKNETTAKLKSPGLTKEKPDDKLEETNDKLNKDDGKVNKKRKLTEIDKLLMDEGAIKMLYDMKNSDENINNNKTKNEPIDVDMAHQDLMNMSKELKNDYLNSTVSKISPKTLRRNVANALNKSLEKNATPASISRQKSKDSTRSSVHSPPASPSMMYTEASCIIRRHSNSSYSSEDEQEDGNVKENETVKENVASERVLRRKNVAVTPDTAPKAKKAKKEVTITPNEHKKTDDSDKKFTKLTESETKYKSISVSYTGHLAQITLVQNKQQKVYFSVQVMKELITLINILNNDENCHVILLTSSGGIFCNGINYKSLIAKTDTERNKLAKEMTQELESLLKLLASVKKILVAGIQGEVEGLGVMMLPIFDMVISSDSSTFSTSYANLGCLPEASCLFTTPGLLGNTLISELLLQARTLTAAEAQKFGLVSRILVSEKFQDELLASTKLVANHSVQFLQVAKKIKQIDLLQVLDKSLSAELKTLVQNWTSAECQKNFSSH